MRRSAIILIVASIVTTAALASVSLGLGHVTEMRGMTSFSGMQNHHMSNINSTLCDDYMASYLNVTQHMGGGTHNWHEDMHSQLNMTEQMQDMHEVNMTSRHIENNYGSCHS